MLCVCCLFRLGFLFPSFLFVVVAVVVVFVFVFFGGRGGGCRGEKKNQITRRKPSEQRRKPANKN